MNHESMEYIRTRCRTDSNGCWVWQLSKMPQGYGHCSHKGSQWYTHRLAWTAANGDIPSGKKIIQDCGNKACCNPDHLVMGSMKDVSHPAKVPYSVVLDILESPDPNVVVAKKHGLSPEYVSSVRCRRARLDVEAIQPVRRSAKEKGRETQKGRKLTADQVDWAIDRCSKGDSQRSVARALNVHYSTVNLILKGKRWDRPMKQSGEATA